MKFINGHSTMKVRGGWKGAARILSTGSYTQEERTLENMPIRPNEKEALADSQFLSLDDSGNLYYHPPQS